MEQMKIGEVSRRTGLTERTLRYYEELGLLETARAGGGHRVYDGAALARLYRIRLLRELGTPLTQIGGVPDDLLATVQRHLDDLDQRMAAQARTREHARTVEAALLRHSDPTDAELLALLAGVSGNEPALTRRLTLLVYRDLEAAARHLIEVFGFGAGPMERGSDGVVVHAEVYAGDGRIWLHREMPEQGLASPATAGVATACMAVSVDDVEAHHERVAATGAEIAYPPRAMPYGVREYGVRDPEGVLWSFMEELDDSERNT